MLPEFPRIERRVSRAIAARFGMCCLYHSAVKRADNVALFWERRDLLGAPPDPWQDEHLTSLVPADTLTPMPAEEAEAAWLDRLEQLLGEEHPS